MIEQYDLGETATISLTVKDDSGDAYTPDTSIKIAIYDTDGDEDVAAVAMTAGSTGQYTYDYATAGKTPGTYRYVVTTVHGDRTTIHSRGYFSIVDGAAPLVHWCVATLADQLRSEIDATPDAAGGTVPDRIHRRVRQLGGKIWTLQDWIFRRKHATLTLASGASTAAMPTDFKELNYRVMRTSDASRYRLLWTQDVSLWQKAKDLYGHDADSSVPRFACLEYASGVWGAKFWPAADAAYQYGYWYVTKDPWQGATPIADNIMLALTYWPEDYDEGWLLLCRMEILKAYRADEAWKDHVGAWKAWRQDHVEENDEYLSDGLEPIQDAMGDFGQTTLRQSAWEPPGGYMKWYGST